MKKIIFFFFMLSFIVNIYSYSNIYDDGNFRMAVFKGWDVLDLNKEYQFEGYSDFWDEPYDFIIKQQEVLKQQQKYIKGMN
ncbi:hypothetical protein [Marinitoga lauensis]|uniref:hypothetical protein n=1 Tax=Marinitoga lauensis TaxID=2201189 RepID=UPI001012CDA3|nr:hypothetical protein [Marinitoga lauensis]